MRDERSEVVAVFRPGKVIPECVREDPRRRRRRVCVWRLYTIVVLYHELFFTFFWGAPLPLPPPRRR